MWPFRKRPKPPTYDGSRPASMIMKSAQADRWTWEGIQHLTPEERLVALDQAMRAAVIREPKKAPSATEQILADPDAYHARMLAEVDALARTDPAWRDDREETS